MSQESRLLPKAILRNVSAADPYIGVELTHPGMLAFMYVWCKQNIQGLWTIADLDQLDGRVIGSCVSFIFEKPQQAQHFQNQVYLMDRRIKPEVLQKMNEWSRNILQMKTTGDLGEFVRKIQLPSRSRNHAYQLMSKQNHNTLKYVFDFCSEHFEMLTWGAFISNKNVYVQFEKSQDANYFSLICEAECLRE